MKTLKPTTPFVFPEPRTLESLGRYEHQPPYRDLALSGRAVFGIVSALTSKGVQEIKYWLEHNSELKVRLILVVYPACATRQEDLSALYELTGPRSERLSIRVLAMKQVVDRGSNALCFMTSGTESAHLVTGPIEDLALAVGKMGCVNFAFQADPSLVESFKRYFDWLWTHLQDINAEGVVQIPDLCLPEGTAEAAHLWKTYMNLLAASDSSNHRGSIVAKVDPDTGDVTLESQGGSQLVPPTEEAGFKKMDLLADWVARIYSKGALVSIDKLSRIPPLDAPMDPKWFGDSAEIQKGKVTRKVSMRISIIDEGMLKEIEKRRQSLRMLLNKFSFGLADNMRWMPLAARPLFEGEMARINKEGQNLIANLLQGDVDKFVNIRRDALAADVNAMYKELGQSGDVTKDIIERVSGNIKDRLRKAQAAKLFPQISYSSLVFSQACNDWASPWGQAYCLLADIAIFPRKLLTDPYFYSGIRTPEDDLMNAMNVADDNLFQHSGANGLRHRCQEELNLLSRIEKASIGARERCEMVLRILRNDKVQNIVADLQERESQQGTKHENGVS